jgi:uncharacterized protein YtpQ (UPF0354 family)
VASGFLVAATTVLGVTLPASGLEQSQIVFRIKNTSFVEQARALSNSPDDVPVTEPLVGDLVVAYAIDLPGVFRMLNASDLRGLGLSRDRLRAVALANVEKQIRQKTTVNGQSPVLLLSTGNDSEACLLLFDPLWDKLKTALPGDIVVAVPTRDILLVTSSESAEGLKVVGEAIAESWKTETTHRISEQLFVRRGAKWDVFREK